MRKTLATLLLGIVLGVLGTFAAVTLAGGWYEYYTIPDERCHRAQLYGEVVPNQPNPCHFRTPRWALIN